MSYKTILAYVDEAERCGTLLALARDLAERQEAHLSGLHVVPNLQIYAAAEASMPAEVFEAQRRFNEEAADAAERAFVTALDGAACDHTWDVVFEGRENIGERVLEHGLVADLIITGQIDPNIASRRRVGTPEHLLMHSGRPLLMVPYTGRFQTVGKTILVAWNASGEAARATFDSLPLLKAANTVIILSVDPQDRPELEEHASAGVLAASLARHGVDAIVRETISGDLGIGSILLNSVADLGCDLIVMGGYGHGRITEFLFGGATRSILQQMTVPVLIAH